MYDKLNNRDPKSASIVETYLPYDDFHEAQRIAYQLDDDYIDITEDEDSKGSHAISTPFRHVKSVDSVQKGVTKPSLYVTISGVPARALCDTGSDYTHVSGTFAKKLTKQNLRTTAWNRPRLYAVNGREVTPQRQFDNLEIRHSELNFTGHVDVGIIREQSYDLLIGMDMMSQVGLVIITSLSTFTLVSDLEKLFQTERRHTGN